VGLTLPTVPTVQAVHLGGSSGRAIAIGHHYLDKRTPYAQQSKAGSTIGSDTSTSVNSSSWPPTLSLRVHPLYYAIEMYLSRWHTTLFIPGAVLEADGEGRVVGLCILLNNRPVFMAPDAGEPNAGEPNAGEPNAGEPNAGEPNAGLTGHSSSVLEFMEGQRNKSLELGANEVVGSGRAGESSNINGKQCS